MSTKKVGVVGLGLMGWALAARLAAQGQKVGGWTRSGVDATRAQADGFEPHAALADLVAESDILILSLFDEVVHCINVSLHGNWFHFDLFVAPSNMNSNQILGNR